MHQELMCAQDVHQELMCAQDTLWSVARPSPLNLSSDDVVHSGPSVLRMIDTLGGHNTVSIWSARGQHMVSTRSALVPPACAPHDQHPARRRSNLYAWPESLDWFVRFLPTLLCVCGFGGRLRTT